MSRISYLTEPFEHIAMRDGVVVVALDDQRNVALVRHTLPLHGEVLSVPGGLVEDGEDPLEAARRELDEEAGLTAGTWRSMGAFVPMPRSTQLLHFFEAADLVVGSPSLTPGEAAQGMALEWWPVDEAVAAVWDGEVKLSGSALALLTFVSMPRPSRTPGLGSLGVDQGAPRGVSSRRRAAAP